MPEGTAHRNFQLANHRSSWRLRRQEMESRPSGRRWRGRLRSTLYHLAWQAHELLRPTRALRHAAGRALRLEQTALSLSFPDLPRAFDGYRVLHLTDLHLDNIHGTAAAAASCVSDIAHDLCVITGDVRDNVHAPLGPLIRELAQIVEACGGDDGIVAVLGNHDSAAMVTPMEEMGIRVLLNEQMTIARRNRDIASNGSGRCTSLSYECS